MLIKNYLDVDAACGETARFSPSLVFNKIVCGVVVSSTLALFESLDFNNIIGLFICLSSLSLINKYHYKIFEYQERNSQNFIESSECS